MLEEAFEHLTEGVLVELACHPRTLTAHNRRALRTGQRIDISRIERVSTRGCSRVEIVRVRDRLDVDELLFRRHRHRHRSSSRRIRGPSSDDPPPF